MEPRVGETAANSDALPRLIEGVNGDNFGVVLDISHQLAQKELLPLSIEKPGRHLCYVHVADNDGRENRHLAPGDGSVDWEEIFRLLGFDGFFSIALEQLPDLRDGFLRAKRFPEGCAEKHSL